MKTKTPHISRIARTTLRLVTVAAAFGTVAAVLLEPATGELRYSLAGHPPTNIATTATVHLEKTGAGFTITGIDLKTRGLVPGVAAAEFIRLAEDTKANCIVSRALASVPMRLDAQLVSA